MASDGGLDARIRKFLQDSFGASSALQISKGIGLSTAKQVNPTLYSLEKQGNIVKSQNGRKVVWQLVHHGHEMETAEEQGHPVLETKGEIDGISTRILEKPDSQPVFPAVEEDHFQDDKMEEDNYPILEESKPQYPFERIYNERSFAQSNKEEFAEGQSFQICQNMPPSFHQGAGFERVSGNLSSHKSESFERRQSGSLGAQQGEDYRKRQSDLSPSSQIPRVPHEMMQQGLGPRAALLHKALNDRPQAQRHGYGEIHRPTTERHYNQERSSQSQRHYSAPLCDNDFSPPMHQSFQRNVENTGYNEDEFQTSPAGTSPPPLMGFSLNSYEEEKAEIDERIVDKIIAFLKQFSRPVSTLEVAKAIGRKTKGDVNPILYEMQDRGTIVKATRQPPSWRLAPAGSNQNTERRAPPSRGQMNQQSTSFRPPGSNSGFSNPSASLLPHRAFGQNQRSFVSNQSQGRSMARQLSWYGDSSQESNYDPKPLPGNAEPHPERHDLIQSSPQHSAQYQHQASGSRLLTSTAGSRQSQVPTEISGISFAALNKNPVSAINEYAQKNSLPISFELLHEAKGGKNKFLVAVSLNGKMYNAVSAANMKDARREAADVALREILSQQSSKSLAINTQMGSKGPLTHFDKIAMLSHQTFIKLSSEVQEKFAGRKVIAAIVMKTYEDETGVVVSLGAGNRCITGDRMNMEGKTVNDSHAEIICRRSFLVFLYSELRKYYSNDRSIFEDGGMGGRLQLKDGFTFHLYISTAPCGDGALFSPREMNSVAPNESSSREHSPLYTSKQQGLLRTKIEDGEGTIPIDLNDGPQTWDGILMGKRLRTMSCTDKICRWNVLGLQGALLSNLIEPIYLESMTLGYLYEHGHLSRGVCCRLSRQSDIDDILPLPYALNHPWLGRVTAYDPPRETEKTNNLSINWYLGSSGTELTDGRIGACLTRTDNAPTPSRLCKAELYKHFKRTCVNVPELQHMSNFETYRETKDNAAAFQKAKEVMNEQFKRSKYGSWVKKPRELELFDV